MTGIPTDPTAAAPRGSLTGLIRSARVKKTRGFNCDLDILDSPDGPVLARGRLYQAESLAWQDHRLLQDIPAYQAGQLLPAVFLNHLRVEAGETLWFVHERWGLHNPWADLQLAVDDCVSGRVTHLITPSGHSDPAGYLVQLDTAAPLGRLGCYGIDDHDQCQPDIEVFLPVEELPWQDGTLADQPARAGVGRLALDQGDQVRARVLEIRHPPKHPVVSLRRLIDHLDFTAGDAFAHRETMAQWRFYRLLNGQTAPAGDAEASVPIPADDKP